MSLQYQNFFVFSVFNKNSVAAWKQKDCTDTNSVENALIQCELDVLPNTERADEERSGILTNGRCFLRGIYKI